jgi:Concanavalin A-like lectin/glucanases superfamily
MSMCSQVLKVFLFTVLSVVIVSGRGGVSSEALAASQIPTAGLVAYYPFSGNTNDASGNGFHCTPIGAVLTSDRFHRTDSAYFFNGVDAFIECPNDPRLGVHVGVDVTVSTWVKPTPKLTEPSITQIIASKYRYYVPETSDFYVGLSLLTDQTVVPSDIHATGQGFDVVTGPPPSFNKWSHIAVVYRGTVGDASLYLDGKLVGAAPITYNPVPSPENLLIGSSPLSTPGIDDPWFGGSIDDVRIYERALTETEVTALAHEQPSLLEDECPNSDLSATVVIDGCDSGVPNTVFPSGCTISDLVVACAEGASNHGQFVSCVSHVTNDLRGTITGQQKGAIQSCAAQANIR